MERLLFGDLTAKIINCYFTVYNELGFGFLEKVYEKALLVEMRNRGIVCCAQVPISIFYHGENVGNYFADIVVEGKVILEVKASGNLNENHEIQIFNYLRASELELGMLLNFGVEAEFRRKVLENKNKQQYKIRKMP